MLVSIIIVIDVDHFRVIPLEHSTIRGCYTMKYNAICLSSPDLCLRHTKHVYGDRHPNTYLWCLKWHMHVSGVFKTSDMCLWHSNMNVVWEEFYNSDMDWGQPVLEAEMKVTILGWLWIFSWVNIKPKPCWGPHIPQRVHLVDRYVLWSTTLCKQKSVMCPYLLVFSAGPASGVSVHRDWAAGGHHTEHSW
jgi:hypothetical protein